MAVPATSFNQLTHTVPAHAPAHPERPAFGPQSRQHSRSSSQLATLASLALSPRAPPAPLPASPRAGALRPLATLDRDGGASVGSFDALRDGASPRGSRRASLTSGSSSDNDTPHCRSDRSSDRERTGSGSTAPSTSSADSSFAAVVPAEVKHARKDRRSTFPAALPTLTSASASPSPVSSPRDPTASAHSSGRSSPASLPPTDPSTPAHVSFPSTSSSLAQFIQHKRRQASAPYFASARSQSLFSPGAGFSLGPSGTEAGLAGTAVSDVPVAVSGAVNGVPERAPSRPRSRASSRRATAMGLSLTTAGLAAPDAADGGLVVTPTTEEWRVLGSELSDLASLRAKEDEDEAARQRAAAKEPPARDAADAGERKAPRWKRWPSLTDDDDDDEEEEDEEDDHSHFALSLSLSSLGKDKHQLPHTPLIPASPRAAAPTSSAPSSPPPIRPTPVPAYKSSFSYTSTGSGVTGGFTSHSNTSSLSRNAHPAASAPAASSGLSAPPMSASGSEGLSGASASTSATASTSSSPSTGSTAFEPSTTRKGDPSVALTKAQALAHTSRPALSRGSLSTATGVLSSPPIPPAPHAAAEPSDAPATTTNGHAPGHDGEPASATKHGMPHIPLAPQVLRALSEDTPAVTGLGVDGFVTPPSVAATPFDGDPFASSAPVGASVPPTPGVGDVAAAPGGAGTAAQSASPPLDGTGAGAVSLDWSRAPGPVDPRTYSAVTGLRDIDAFVCEDGEAGKGAYGSVRRAREKGPDGQPIGPELVVKYVIKQRILADCWKKHKVLGPIPIEVHVLDHLRRVPYEPRPRLNYLSRRSGGTRKSIGPGQHVRRDSAPQLDLWHGGADGAPVQTGHPNVCPLLDFWEDAHYYYLVMPSATAEPTCSANPRRGQDLFDFVDAHPDGLSPEPLQRILAQIADAVCFLHEHSIVHRDIKDENVVLDPEGNVRLIDFGSAAYVREGRKFDTFSGTLDFAAPEVLKGARYSGKEQDIWALGVLGYVLICGECPFWSPDEAMRGLSPGSRALAALEAKATAGEGIMAHAVDLVRRCLEINAADRPCADAVCDHAFFVGAEEGWSGERGWERAAGGGAE